MEYPKNVKLKNQIYGHGGVRAHPVTVEEAMSIADEFTIPLPEQDTNPAAGYYYISSAEDKKHELLFADERTAWAHASRLVPEKYSKSQAKYESEKA